MNDMTWVAAGLKATGTCYTKRPDFNDDWKGKSVAERSAGRAFRLHVSSTDVQGKAIAPNHETSS